MAILDSEEEQKEYLAKKIRAKLKSVNKYIKKESFAGKEWSVDSLYDLDDALESIINYWEY